MFNLFNFLLTAAALLCLTVIYGQSVTGYVLDEDNNPVPFANLFIPEADVAANSNSEGKYSMNVNPGNYDMLISCIGYEEKRINIDVGDNATVRNIYLKFSDTELEEAVIRAKGRDPAYAIIKNAQDNRKKFLKQIDSYRNHIYLKASEEKIIKEKKKRKPDAELDAEGEPSDELAMDADLEPKTPENSVSFLEMDVDFHFQYPNKTKEFRTAYQAYGDKSGFLVPRLHETNFNLYENLVSLKGISEMPFISPVSSTAILSYKFKLVHTSFIQGQKVYEIQITPRKKTNSTIKGTIWINDGLWNIRKVLLELPKDALKFHDDVTLEQSYENLSDSTWLISNQEFNYLSKANKYKIFEGKTIIKYSNYEINVEFPKKFFSSEVGVTTQEALERDSTYWSGLRPEPLTPEEQKLIHMTDSIEAFHKSPEYLDSLQRARNKIELLEVLWQGVGFMNYKKKQEVFVNSIVDFLDYSLVDGLRLGPGGSYSRRYESQKYLRANGYANMSLRTGHLNGSLGVRALTNPMKRAWTDFRVNRGFVSINPYDAYLSQLLLVNYIQNESVYFNHHRELVNGLYVGANVSWRNRQPLGDLVQPDEFLDDVIGTDELYDFQAHQAVITQFSVAFTPKQMYMTEPKRKVILGSKYPTFYADYTHGWKGVLSSDVNFDLLEFGITQSVPLGTIGYSKYNIVAGKFFKTNELFEMDKKRIRQSDPILFSEPLRSFQFLDTSLVTTNWFIEGHYIHHFNGALINNFPLIKKLKLRTVAGASGMWLQDDDYRHAELLAGVERVFKLGARRRLKLGVYGVVAHSNKTPTTTGIKFAIDIIDTWKKDWSF
ncbi:MAG: DUF5686 and carboxypeptidase regulatory-like domain-containing protein [Flavobacteriales bacterium]